MVNGARRRVLVARTRTRRAARTRPARRSGGRRRPPGCRLARQFDVDACAVRPGPARISLKRLEFLVGPGHRRDRVAQVDLHRFQRRPGAGVVERDLLARTVFVGPYRRGWTPAGRSSRRWCSSSLGRMRRPAAGSGRRSGSRADRGSGCSTSVAGRHGARTRAATGPDGSICPSTSSAIAWPPRIPGLAAKMIAAASATDGGRIREAWS